MELIVVAPIAHQGDALDWVLEQYKKEDLLSIMWVETDGDGNHHFKVTIRPKKSPEPKDGATGTG